MQECTRNVELFFLLNRLSPDFRIISADPADISACLHAGVLPACYENTNIFVEVLQSEQLGCFQRSEDQKTVLIRIRDDIPKQKERLCISEHPFGTVKWHHGAHYVLCKGLWKTTAELRLSFLAYNLRQAVNMIGTKAILEGIKA